MRAEFATAAAVLNGGGVAVIPTDTVYGLAARPDFPAAVDRLYTIKGRAAGKPIAMLASDVAAVERLGYPLSGRARALADAYWPGGLTLVLPPAPEAAGRVAEGFRVPDHAATRELIAACGGVLRVTSANLSGRRPATDAPQALAAVGLSADFVVDDGVSPGGEPSTVVRVLPDGEVEVLRAGAVKIRQTADRP
ncbi:MAG: L-threonylcarbamoyladenylate synthase [Kiritimatiellia bacterium]